MRIVWKKLYQAAFQKGMAIADGDVAQWASQQAVHDNAGKSVSAKRPRQLPEHSRDRPEDCHKTSPDKTATGKTASDW